jgi:nucleoside 2-deoxyribosyltransferase
VRRIYLACPLRGDRDANLDRVRALARQVALRGDCPVYSHEFVHALDDNDPAEREIGMRCALALLEVCDELLVAGEISEGVRAEVQCASGWGIPVRFREATP